MNEEIDDLEGTKSYILNLCSAIGGFEQTKGPDDELVEEYAVGDEALACLKDLKKAIRLDSQNNEKTVLNTLKEYNVVRSDIVPLILSFREHRNEVSYRFILACVELLVPMTWPLEKNVEDDEQEKEDPNVIECYRKYKLELMESGVFEVILDMTMQSLRIPPRDRSIIDQTTIRLCLYLFRNLTAIPDLNRLESGTSEQIRMSHMQEYLLIRYYESDVIELFLTIASNSDRQNSTTEWILLILESLNNILKHVDPKDVFLCKLTEEQQDQGRAELEEVSAKLSNLLTEENTRKKAKTKYVPSRHNRFGGTYILDWDGKQKISHRQEAGYADTTYLIENEKNSSRIGLKRKAHDGLGVQKVYQDRTALKFLKLTARAFILSCFNTFFTSITKDMERQDAKIVSKDTARFYMTMRWFLEYHCFEYKATLKRKESQLNLPSRSAATDTADHDVSADQEDAEFDFSLVAHALDLRSVLFCLRNMREKLEDKSWFDVRAIADCFKQMLVDIGIMAKSTDEEYRDIAEHIQSNLYYEQLNLDLFVDLIKRYKSQSNAYLKSVIMLTHMLLKLLDSYQKGKKMLFVRKKQTVKKKKNNSHEEEEERALTDESDNEEIKRERTTESREYAFKFNSFEKRYETDDVVRAYCSLLQLFKELEPEYFTCIASMFHRLMVKRKAEYFFWKLPVLELFNRILTQSNSIPRSEGFSELEQFITYSTHQLFKAAKEYPLLFVEALVPNIKSNRKTWELPDQRAAAEEQRYMEDVNYIPSSTTANNDGNNITRRGLSGLATAATTSHSNNEKDINMHDKPRTENENGSLMDDDMLDYYYSAFDQKKQEEAAALTSKGKNRATNDYSEDPFADNDDDIDTFALNESIDHELSSDVFRDTEDYSNMDFIFDDAALFSSKSTTAPITTTDNGPLQEESNDNNM